MDITYFIRAKFEGGEQKNRGRDARDTQFCRHATRDIRGAKSAVEPHTTYYVRGVITAVQIGEIQHNYKTRINI